MPEALESDTVDGWLALDDADAAGAAYALVAFLARNLWGAKIGSHLQIRIFRERAPNFDTLHGHHRYQRRTATATP